MEMCNLFVTGFIGLVGVIIGFLLECVRQYFSSARIHFAEEPIIYEFEESIRFAIEVLHGGSQFLLAAPPISNTIGYLTIEVEKNRVRSNFIPKNIVVEKRSDTCVLIESCRKCEYKYKLCPYLATYGEKIKVDMEPLPWTLPLKNGEGMNNIPYCHLTFLPPKGSCKLLLFDVYKFEKENSLQYYLVKVHSEYGHVAYPRICLKLPLENPLKEKLVFKLTVGGTNVRKEAKCEVRIEYTREDYIVKYNSKTFSLKELLKNKKSLKFN